MKRADLRHPFTQAILILLIAYLAFEFGIAYLPPLLGAASAPVPDSVLLQYMLTVLVGVLIWVSDNETRWSEFKRPIERTLVEPGLKPLRIALLVLVPLLVGAATFMQVRPSVAAPASLRSIHPAPPTTIDFRGEQMTLTGLENPLRHAGSLAQHYATGRRVYYQNCLPCHGDALDGAGHFAHGFNPAPLDFSDVGTIAQLSESFVFWRIAKGGPGLPREGAPWHSAMPAWEDFLTEEEVWAVIIFMYEQTGHQPRGWEVVTQSAGGEH
ncbi:MAG: c-type cytochrome [Longimicrobiales bacterium]